MIQIGTVGDGQRGRIEARLPAGLAWSSDMLCGRDDPLTPHVFFVHQDPHVVLERHYHDAAEFQVVVGGGGKLGTHEVRPFSVHYASSQAVYGPLVAGAEGLDYVTFRAVYQRGLFKFPEERQRMAAGRRAQLTGDVAPLDPSMIGEPAVESVIAATDGGLAAWVVRLPSGGAVAAPIHPHGSGRFLLLTSGSATVHGSEIKALEVGWIGNREAALFAGSEGAELIVLQLPSET